MKKQSSLYRHHLMDKHVSGISRIMSWAASLVPSLPRTFPPSYLPSLVPSLPRTAPHPLQQHSRSMHPCGNPRSSPAAAPQQPRSSPAAAPQQPLHCSPCIAAHSAGAGGGGAVTCGGDRRLRSRGARRASRARARTCTSPAPDSGGPTTYSALPMAVSVIYTAHSTAPLPLTSTPHQHPST